ncbi:unnamed protein product [Protopolystoma xenopodis]|uniref:Uncharacterized protein n=1 Tax=Protopolystoma xenopodis TaxID=117903 RepID=A0A3S5AZ57_9PLAT|nr:unnamed protein product [Protopolystoma xenopodis]
MLFRLNQVLGREFFCKKGTARCTQVCCFRMSPLHERRANRLDIHLQLCDMLPLKGRERGRESLQAQGHLGGYKKKTGFKQNHPLGCTSVLFGAFLVDRMIGLLVCLVQLEAFVESSHHKLRVLVPDSVESSIRDVGLAAGDHLWGTLTLDCLQKFRVLLGLVVGRRHAFVQLQPVTIAVIRFRFGSCADPACRRGLTGPDFSIPGHFVHLLLPSKMHRFLDLAAASLLAKRPSGNKRNPSPPPQRPDKTVPHTRPQCPFRGAAIGSGHGRAPLESNTCRRSLLLSFFINQVYACLRN